MIRPPPRSTPFPYPTLFRSWLDPGNAYRQGVRIEAGWMLTPLDLHLPIERPYGTTRAVGTVAAILTAPHAETALSHVEEAERSEEHTSELQSPCNLVCRLLL